MDSMIEGSEVKSVKSGSLLDLLDDETRRLLATFPGTGERGGLTETDYHKVMDILFEKTGKVPTQNFVQKATSGSFTTIGPALRTWKANFENKAHPVEEKEVAPIPEALAQVTSELITSAIQQIGTKIWETSANFHSKAIESERQVMQGELAKAEQAIVEANQASDELNSELTQVVAKHQETLGQLTELLDSEKKRVVDLTKLVDALKTDLGREKGRTQEIERERDKYRSENARLTTALSHSEGEIERVKALLEAAKQRATEVDETTKQMREAAERRERSATAEIDGLKTEKAEFKRAIDAGRIRADRDLAAAKEEAKIALAAQASTFEDQVKAAKAEAAAAQKTVEALSAQIEMLKKQAQKPKTETKPAEKPAVLEAAVSANKGE